MKYAAVVVSYNRREALRRALEALLGQSRPLEGVIVVDNASTDGAADMVATEFPQVMLYRLPKNLGGAGGFAWGIELALALGFSGAWVMDDDAAPLPDSFEKLLTAGEEHLGPTGAGFLCSVAVDEKLGYEQAAGHPIPSGNFVAQSDAVRQGLIAVSSAAFLGVLVNLERARSEELPNPDFFIWCDDVEYTHRLAAKYGGLCALESLVIHSSPALAAAEGQGSLGWKYFYQVRNRLWLARWGQGPANHTERIYSAVLAVRATLIEIRVNRKRVGTLRTSVTAWYQGLFRPRHPHPVGSLLVSSEQAQEWVRRQRPLVDRSANASPAAG